MNRKVFFELIRPLFGGRFNQSQVDGISGILDAFEDIDEPAEVLAYGLATAFHETGRRMIPVREGFARTDAGARAAVERLARRRGPNSAVARYARPDGPYGHVYYGRGHVQLTWLENYARSSAEAGVDLVKYPDAMLDPEISSRVLFAGLLDGRWNGRGKGLRYYIDRGDILGARRTVNVQDKARLIAGYYEKFLSAIRAAGAE